MQSLRDGLASEARIPGEHGEIYNMARARAITRCSWAYRIGAACP